MGRLKQKLKIFPLALAFFMFLGIFSGCIEDVRGVEEPLPDISSAPENPGGFAADNVFSLNYSSAVSLNPMTTTNANNVLVTQLMYDNIYDVDSSFAISSNIITEAQSENGINWYFTVDTGVKFWDGSALSAYDVVYSIQRAMQSSRLRGRLGSIYGVSASSDEKFAVTLYGHRPNMQLPALLTIPVIKSGSIDEAAPMGTGFFMPDESHTKLTLFTEHKNAETVPIDTVYLKEFSEIDDAINAFENSEIDLVTNDPTGILNLGYGSANEVRNYPTTNMHYLGFNSESLFFSRELFRFAMTYVVNRWHIVNDIMGGSAIEAAMPVNPGSALYNNSYADLISYSVKKSEAALDAAEVQDYDDDGFREIMVNGIPMETEIDFIVCSDSAQKAFAAKSIADNMIALGLKVTLRELSWDAYTAALSSGDFDMYYAETMLTADFYPGLLMLKGESLNYGKFDDSALAERINDYMTAGDADRKKAADLMNKYITDMSPIVTICFERHQVISHRGVISGMKPNKYNIFYNIAEWKVDLS